MNGIQSNFEILIVGRYFCDLVFTGLPEFPRLGHEVYSRDFHLIPGGVYNSAIALHRLGVKVVWPCQFGNDPFSQYVKSQALGEGVNSKYFTDLDYPSIHLTAAISFEKERAFLSYSDPLPKYAYRQLIKDTSPRWIYITHLLLGEELVELVTAGREAGAQIFMDCQAHDHRIDETKVREALQKVDVFSPNRAEASNLTGEIEMDLIVEKMARFVPVVIIKDGSNGCYYQDSQQNLHMPAKVIKVADTTGAGDNFDSGFLYGHIRGYPVEKCLQIANICGGLSVSGYGGTSTSPNEAQMLSFLQK